MDTHREVQVGELDALIDRGAWSEIAVTLANAGSSDAAAAVAWAVLDAVAAGDAFGAVGRELLRHLPADWECAGWSLPLTVLAADAGVRAWTADRDRVAAIAGRLRRSPQAVADADLMLWLTAVRGELAFSQRDPGAVAYAITQPFDRPTYRVCGHLARCRLVRLQGATLLAFDVRSPEAYAHLERARAGFAEVGALEELVWTDVMVEAATATDQVDSDNTLERQVALAERLGELGSLRAAPTWLIFAGLAVAREDIAAAGRFLEGAVSGGVGLGKLANYVALLDAVHELGKGRPAKSLIDGLADLVAALPSPGARRWAAELAAPHVLDRGRLDVLAKLHRHAAEAPFVPLPRTGPAWTTAQRQAILEHGVTDAVAEIEKLVTGLEASGRSRAAARLALRAAWDLRRAGIAATDADRLWRWGAGQMPSDVDGLDRALVDGSLAPARPPDEVHLFGPDVVVVRSGDRITLSAGPALLLAVLVTERSWLTDEQVIERLWPGVDVDSGRNRLKLALHRLRTRLALDGDELIVREPGRIRVNGAGWCIDLWEFLDMCRGGPGERMHAFHAFTAEPCTRQGAYDETMIALRDSLRAKWADLTTGLVEDGLLDRGEAVSRARSLGIELD
jgi:hypothetical protein